MTNRSVNGVLGIYTVNDLNQNTGVPYASYTSDANVNMTARNGGAFTTASYDGGTDLSGSLERADVVHKSR